MGLYDNSVSGNENIFFDVNGNLALTVDSIPQSTQEELYIGSSDTFRPSADVNTNNIEIVGILTANGNTINVSGSWINNGTFTPAASTVTFNGSTSGTIGSISSNNIQ